MSSLVVALLGAIGSALSYFFRRKGAADDARQSSEMVANEVAKQEVKRVDEIETTVIKASTHNEKSLEDLRRLASE